MEGHLLVPGTDQVVYDVAEVCVCVCWGGGGLVAQTLLKYVCGTCIYNHVIYTYMYMYST